MKKTFKKERSTKGCLRYRNLHHYWRELATDRVAIYNLAKKIKKDGYLGNKTQLAKKIMHLLTPEMIPAISEFKYLLNSIKEVLRLKNNSSIVYAIRRYESGAIAIYTWHGFYWHGTLDMPEKDGNVVGETVVYINGCEPTIPELPYPVKLRAVN